MLHAHPHRGLSVHVLLLTMRNLYAWWCTYTVVQPFHDKEQRCSTDELQGHN